MSFAKKIKLIRNANNLTQEQFAKSIGISRSNMANLEVSKVTPTQLLINCICLTYNVDKEWLTNDTDNDTDLINLKSKKQFQNLIIEKYEQLDDVYKKFIENQIKDLLKIQNNEE